MLIRMTRPAAAALALTLGLSLAGCASSPSNRSLDSIKQPVVQRTSLALDLNAGAGGLPITEQKRLNDWFAAMSLDYGDRVSIDDPISSKATKENVAEIAGRYGLLVSDGAPVTPGFVQPGTVRVVVTRSEAHVPGCPDWQGRANYNYNNATNEGFGCAINGNLAAMVADPEHLIHGAEGTGETVIMTSDKAIESYRKQAPTGDKGLTAVSSASGAGGSGGSQ
jgi:pilus assembly protein CpaD